MVKLTTFLLFLTLMANPAIADSVRFITDEAKIPVRKGKGTKFKIVTILDSGTEVQLEQSDEDGFSRIKVPDGRIAWVPTRFLLDSPIARVRLESLQGEYDKLVEASGDVSGTIEALEFERDALEERVSEVTRSHQSLIQEMASLRERAANPLQIAERNEQLKDKLESSQVLVSELKNEIQVLQHDARRNWFLAGGAVALGSLILGLVIPRVPWRRRRGWGEY
ncbi:MAG: TIGR04211 family SH3 domain-containing protein [Pseudomonadota bacterium]|nr:TIGR04211 family SH3 domain-containing protein [Pseudomonadota bacterium]